MTEFDYDDIMDGYTLARQDGLQPTQIHLGIEEKQELLKDTNFTRAKTVTSGNKAGIGKVAGLDVQQAPIQSLRVMTAQEDDYLAYYVL